MNHATFFQATEAEKARHQDEKDGATGGRVGRRSCGAAEQERGQEVRL